MHYGMTYEQFWFGDPWMAKDYAQAYILKRKVRNEEMWLQGLYNAHALQTIIGNAFGGKRLKYLEKPLDIFPKTEIEKEQEVIAERQKVIENLSLWKKAASKQTGVDKNGKP